MINITQPLPSFDSPIAESPEYVVESDLKEDPEEYKDDETEDGESLARCTASAALPLPPLPPPLHMPPPVDRRDDIPETEMPPRKRLCLSTLSSRTRISQQVVVDSQWVDLLVEDRIAHQETIQIVEDEAYATQEAWAHSIGLSQAVHFEPRTHQEQMQQTEIAELRETDHRRQAQMVETLRVMGDMRREMGDMQAELLALREQPRRVGQLGGDARVNFATCTLLDVALTWWNSQIRSLGPDAYSMTWEFVADETEKIDKYISGLPGNIYENVKASKHKTLDKTIELANNLMDQKLRTYAERKSNNKRKADYSFRNNHGHQQQTPKRQNVTRVYNMRTGERKSYSGNLPKSSGNANVANAQRNNGANPKGNGCFECGATGHLKRECLKLRNKDGEKVNAPGWVYAVGNAEKRQNASREPDSNVVMGTFLLNNRYASILFDTGANRSFISIAFSSLIDIVPTPLGNSYDVELADGKIVEVDTIMRGCTLNFLSHPFKIDLMPIELGSFDVIIGMDWLRRCHAVIVCDEKLVRIPYRNETLTFCGDESNNRRESRLIVILCSKAQEYMAKGCQVFLAQISTKEKEDRSEGKQLEDVPVVRDFLEVFPTDLPGLPPARPMEILDRLNSRSRPRSSSTISIVSI
uniref:CCHC-type domain-containing protein n=1 Tax=Tanacetum cinerariifolium TaxID=118510 RepID=A0A6L2J7L1_TANCI|nr:hypothetical protein [Tanacetum cinerariifolium]